MVASQLSSLKSDIPLRLQSFGTTLSVVQNNLDSNGNFIEHKKYFYNDLIDVKEKNQVSTRQSIRLQSQDKNVSNPMKLLGDHLKQR